MSTALRVIPTIYLEFGCTMSFCITELPVLYQGRKHLRYHVHSLVNPNLRRVKPSLTSLFGCKVLLHHDIHLFTLFVMRHAFSSFIGVLQPAHFEKTIKVPRSRSEVETSITRS